MDILAAIVVYLGSVTGIIAALTISFVLYFSPPHQVSPPNQNVAMLVRQNTPKAPPLPQRAEAGTTTEQQETRAPTTVAQSVPPQHTIAAASAGQLQAMRTQHYLRREIQEERAKRWAYQQDPSFENRFLGYAD